MADQNKLSHYLQRIETAERWRDSAYRDKWERFYKRYRNHVDPILDEKGQKVKGRSNISVPYTFTMVETVLPRLVESMFVARPYVSVIGRPKDRQEYLQFANAALKPWDLSAKKNEQLLDYQQNQVFDIQDKFHSGLKTMCIYGTTVGYVGWKYEERKVIRLQKVTQDGFDSWQPFEENAVAYDDPELAFLDLGLFYTDPQCSGLDDARYCGHVEYLPRSYLDDMRRSKVWDIDFDKIAEAGQTTNQARNRRLSMIGMPTTDGYLVAGQEQQPDDLFEVHRYWEDNRCVVLINRCWVARDTDNPFWHKQKPYVHDTYCRVPNEFYGIGLVEMIEDLQDELNAERNQRIDNRSRALRRFYTQKRSAKISPPNFDMRNGGRVLVDDHDDIKEWEHRPLTGDTFTQEGIIKNDMRDTTGAHDVVMGTGGGGTATETMTKDNNASLRFKLVISSAEKRLLVRISTMMIQLNQQFIDAPRVMELDDATFTELMPDEIQGQYRLIAAGSAVEPLANKEAHKQRMLQMYQAVAADPMFIQNPVYRRNMLALVLESFGIEELDDLLPPVEQLVPSAPPTGSGSPPPAAPLASGANVALQAEQPLGGGL